MRPARRPVVVAEPEPVRRGEAWAERCRARRAGLVQGPLCRRANPALSAGVASRRTVWMELTSRTVWDFDRRAAFVDAVLVLTRGSKAPIDGYLAANSILDVWEGRPPTARVPESWRALPAPVLTVLRLVDGERSVWFDDRDPKLADETIREASKLAADAEADGDERGRAMFSDVVSRRRGR